MINTTDRPWRRHFVGDLMIVEMPNMAHGRTWTVQPEDDYILIEANLDEAGRRLALTEALVALSSAQKAPLVPA